MVNKKKYFLISYSFEMCLKPSYRYLPINIKFMVYSTTAAVINSRLSSIFQL